MNNYKTAGHYLLELLKILIFGALLAWLVSCSNRKQGTIDLIHAYRDSIGVAEAELFKIDYAAKQIEEEYSFANEPKFFDNTTTGERARKEWLAKERTAYRQMIKRKGKYEDTTFAKKIALLDDIGRYRTILDSLKLQLYN